MESGQVAAVVSSLVLVACPARDGDVHSSATQSSSDPSPKEPSSAAQSVEPHSPAPPAPDFRGSFSGAPCGERQYERVITLEAEGAVRGQDNVSPCPPNVQCVWSGIVRFAGRWVLEGERAVLTLKPESSHPIAPLPSELRWSSSGPMAIEAGASCAYRALSEPSP